MADFKISGRMTVKNLKKQFKDAFGSTLRVYNGAKFADDDATLASIRKGDSKGGELEVKGNMQVGNFEKKMMELYGIKVQVASSDDSKLVDNSLTLSQSGK
jgi:hypothetical protein